MDNGMELETIYIKEEIILCETLDELKDRIIPLLNTQQEQWIRKINEAIEESGMTKTDFAKAVGVSRVAVNNWCNGALPRKRENYILIGLAAGYDRERMDQLLQRYGQQSALYAKRLEDCVCIFVMEHKYGKDAVERYKTIIKTIKENIIGEPSKEVMDILTQMFEEKLSDVRDESELEVFIKENTAVFSSRYNKFYSSVIMELDVNIPEIGGNVSKFALGQGWTASLEQSVSAIRQKKWIPTREKIISLGIHLGMCLEEIDDMMDYAYLEPLCAKNIFESVIIFVLKQAEENGIFNRDSQDYYLDSLLEYTKKMIEELDIPEVIAFIGELAGLDNEDEEW